MFNESPINFKTIKEDVLQQLAYLREIQAEFREKESMLLANGAPNFLIAIFKKELRNESEIKAPLTKLRLLEEEEDKESMEVEYKKFSEVLKNFKRQVSTILVFIEIYSNKDLVTKHPEITQFYQNFHLKKYKDTKSTELPSVAEYLKVIAAKDNAEQEKIKLQHEILTLEKDFTEAITSEAQDIEQKKDLIKVLKKRLYVFDEKRAAEDIIKIQKVLDEFSENTKVEDILNILTLFLKEQLEKLFILFTINERKQVLIFLQNYSEKAVPLKKCEEKSKDLDIEYSLIQMKYNVMLPLLLADIKFSSNQMLNTLGIPELKNVEQKFKVKHKSYYKDVTRRINLKEQHEKKTISEQKKIPEQQKINQSSNPIFGKQKEIEKAKAELKEKSSFNNSKDSKKEDTEPSKNPSLGRK